MKSDQSSRSWANTLLLSGFGLAAGFMVLLIAASFFVPPIVDDWVETYTDSEPMRVANSPVGEAERENVEARMDAFVEGLEESSVADSELVLTEDELRALIANEQDESKPRVGMQLQLLPGRIRTAVSVPIEDDVSLGPVEAKTRGRYLNGYATIAVRFADGILDLNLESVETQDGKSFPGWAVRYLNRELESAWDDEEVRDVAAKLSRIEIREGAVVLRGNGQTFGTN